MLVCNLAISLTLIKVRINMLVCLIGTKYLAICTIFQTVFFIIIIKLMSLRRGRSFKNKPEYSNVLEINNNNMLNTKLVWNFQLNNSYICGHDY